jgi:hypothetical protein
MPPMQQRYFDILMERVRNDRYPSHQLLDRIEVSMYTPEQIIEYVDMLLEKIDESWYPSHQLMTRVQLMLAMTARAAA